MRKIILALVVFLLFQNFSGQIGNKPGVEVLNMADGFSRPKEVRLSTFLKNLKYIPLETNPDALISESAKFEVTNEYVIVRQIGSGRMYQILLFDRNNGRFLREIGKQGRGPGEYAIFSPLPYNPVKKEFYAIDPSRDILVYDLMGNNIDRIKMPGFKNPEANDELNSVVLVTFNSILDGNIFVGYVVNNSGIEKKKHILLSKDGILKMFPNYLTSDASRNVGLFFPPPWDFVKFHLWDNKVNFIETYCDTLYQITKETLIPRYFFSWGRYNAPYSKQLEIKENGHYYDYFYIIDIDENKNNIFLRIFFNKLEYLAFIEKENSKVTFCKIGDSGLSGFKDDIDGLMDVIPQDITPNNEMIYIIQPATVIKWLKENPEKASQARNKIQWIKNINEFSNPIVAVGSCKD